MWHLKSFEQFLPANTHSKDVRNFMLLLFVFEMEPCLFLMSIYLSNKNIVIYIDISCYYIGMHIFTTFVKFLYFVFISLKNVN